MRFVSLVEAHPEYKRVYLDMWRYRSVEMHDSVTEQSYSSGAVVDDELIRISRELKKVNCAVAEMKGSYMLFMSRLNYILPTSPGVLYSLDGRNPNEVDDEFLNSKKPFVLIKDRWYMSRRLVLFPSRGFYTKRPLPKSLIDRSLRDPGPVSTETTILLCQAAKARDIKWVQSLISSGADVDAKNEEGFTPLHIAAESGQKAVVELLISHGADVNAKTENGDTPLLHTAREGHADVVELLLSNGTDVNAMNRAKRTPLHEALRWGKYDVAELLVNRGADVNAKDGIGSTPLHYAASRGSTNIVKLLFIKSADVNAKRTNGQTPLHCAAQQGHINVVKLILAKGANVSAKDKDGRTALDLAREANHPDVVEFLSGANVSAEKRPGDSSSTNHP